MFASAQRVQDKFNEFEKQFEKRYKQGEYINQTSRCNSKDFVALKALSYLMTLVRQEMKYDLSIEEKQQIIFVAYSNIMCLAALNTKIAKDYTSLLKDYAKMMIENAAVDKEIKVILMEENDS